MWHGDHSRPGDTPPSSLCPRCLCVMCGHCVWSASARGPLLTGPGVSVYTWTRLWCCSDARRRCHHQGTGNTTLTNAVIYAESRLYTCDYQWYFRYFSLLFSQCPGRRGARAGCQDRVSSANTESELPTFQTDTQQPTHQPITFLKLQIMVFIETDNFVSEGVRNLILIIQFYSIHSLLLNILPLPQS